MTETIKRKAKKRRTRRMSNPRFILLDLSEKWREQLGKARAVVCDNEKDIRNVLSNANKNSLWISSRSEMTDELLRAMSHTISQQRDASRRIGDLLMLESPRSTILPILHSWFGTLIGETPSFKKLPDDQLREVLSAPDKKARGVFIGGVVDTRNGLLTLVRGNLARITVPLAIFRPSGTSKPNFRQLALDDYGHTVRSGHYEATADFILYEADADYRRRINAKRRAVEKGFGPSLRRLRIQRGLSRDSFPGIAAKTIARLERGEVARPHGKTLRVISDALRVSSEEIETY